MFTDNKKKCPHFSKLSLSAGKVSIEAPFIKPQIVTGWMCLYDGCFRKALSPKQLIEQSKKLDQKHKIFINMSTLCIYCTLCQEEILDQSDNEVIKQIRQAAMEKDPEQQKILFAGNMEYPPSFQKQKQGVCGTMGSELNSYVDSILQLFAHIPVFYNIAEQYDDEQSKANPLISVLFQKIRAIRSGKYRILKIHDLQKIIETQNDKFMKYNNKNPSSLKYEILRIFSQEFSYDALECTSKKILNPLPFQSKAHSKKSMISYGPMKTLFAGNFKWIGKCQVCSHEKPIKSQFQCIRLECNQKALEFRQYIELTDLIKSTFDLFCHQNNPFSMERQGKICEKCSNQQQNQMNFYLISKQKSHINMPNMLLLEFGTTSQGLRVNVPDELDLTPYSNQSNLVQKQLNYQYIGSIGFQQKKYVTHIRQEKQTTGIFRNILFNRVFVKEGTKIQKPINVKIAIFKLKPLIRNKNISKNIQSSIEVDVKCILPLPDFWYHYISKLRYIQPLVNPLICMHGLLKPNVQSKQKQNRKIPPQIYQYLVEEFGGIKNILKTGKQKCPCCLNRLKLLQQIKASERQMAHFADKLSNKKGKVCIDKQWLQKWKKYLYQQCSNKYLMEGYPRPGPINNTKWIKDGNHSIDQSKYKKISPQVWYFFKRFYGGGPLITLKKVQPSLALVQAVDLRYETMMQKIQQYTLQQ